MKHTFDAGTSRSQNRGRFIYDATPAQPVMKVCHLLASSAPVSVIRISDQTSVEVKRSE